MKHPLIGMIVQRLNYYILFNCILKFLWTIFMDNIAAKGNQIN